MTRKPGTSQIGGMRALDPDARRVAVADAAGLDPEEVKALSGNGVLSIERANAMIENVVGQFELPMGIATNFLINGRDYLIPMAVEEASVVAAASHMAKLARQSGGFQADADDPVMRAQIQVLRVPDPDTAEARVCAAEADIVAQANACDPVLLSLGGGCRGVELHRFETSPVGPMLVIHLLVDVRDAMGANAVNTMAEKLAPVIEDLTGGEVRLRILSNLADRRLARAFVRISVEDLMMNGLEGAEVAQRVVEAAALAVVDPYRAATHNKGIMNGIDPVVVATGNDWRAIEAGAHAFAAAQGRYQALSQWHVADAQLVGQIELPMALGLVGGATKAHPAAQAALRVLGVTTAAELAGVVAAVGLAQNLAALRALATEGIQKGHMALHARNLAITAGALGGQVDDIAAKMVRAGDVSLDAARALLGRDQT